MSDVRFQRLMAAFDEASELQPHDRGPVLDKHCGGEIDLRREVEELLAEHDRTERSVAPAVATARGVEALDLPPIHEAMHDVSGGAIPVLKGAYRLLRTIGHGGMGVVYEAQQAFPRRRVALKAIRPGIATGAMLRRFRTEVELLARLHHPGIAQIYEAGVASEDQPDQAFFVMELVDGLPLNRYAALHRPSLPERLQLLRRVCDAVQHAHERGVIHRDLKPANILVTHAGQPKVLDFGIARAVDQPADGTLATHAGQAIGTPSYMSPEQIAGQPVDTRSDVYALGVVGYELLTGALPFDFSTTPIVEAARRLAEASPPPLSTHDRALRGDVELIIATAMHRDRERRYPSAAALADDLDRVLTARPISARRDSTSYVLAKLARRHWPLVVLAACLLASITAFGVAASVLAARNARLARESDAARQIAERQTDLARAAAAKNEEELRVASIEQARLEAAAGNLALAEDVIWGHHLAMPADPVAFWALRELYRRVPVLQTVATGVWSRTTLSADGTRAVAITPEHAAVVHDTRTGAVAFRIELGRPDLRAIALSADGALAIIGFNDGAARVQPLREHAEPIALGPGPAHAGGVTYTTVSPTGKIAATFGADKIVRLWDIATGEQVNSWPWPQGSVVRWSFSPDGSRLVAIDRSAGVQPVSWRVPSGEVERHLDAPADHTYFTLAFAPDGRSILLGASDRRVRRVDLATGQSTTLDPDFGGVVQAIAPSADGRRLLVSGTDGLTLHTPDGDRFLGRQRRTVIAARWLDERTAVIATEDGLLRTIDLAPEPTLQRLGGFTSWCFSAAFSPDGTTLAVGDSGGQIAVVDAADPSERRVLGEYIRGFRTRGLRILPDSTTIVAGGNDGGIRIYSTSSPTPLARLPEDQPQGGEIYGMDVDPAGRVVAAGHTDRRIRVWDLATRTKIADMGPLDRRVEGIAFSPTAGVLASSGPNAGVQLWDTSNWQPTHLLETTAQPWGVAFSPDGSRLAVSTYDGTINVFDIAARTRLSVMTGHSRLVPAIAYSPDGSMIASGGEDGSLRLWHAATFRRLTTFEPGGNEVVTAAFHPSGRWLAASTAFRFTALYDFQGSDASIRGNEPYQRGRTQR